MSEPVFLSWSSGKDSAWALHTLQQDPRYDVVGLVTTINGNNQRVAMHGVRAQLLQQQADAANLPLHCLSLPDPCSNEQYETIMRDFIRVMQANDIQIMAFGDLYLDDIRHYRENQLAGTGITPLFPLWNIPTRQLARDIIDAGVIAHLGCVDSAKLDPAFAGRRYDHELLADLPGNVDPCGENGEFHTCVTAGPMFRHDLPVTTGVTVERDGFVFTDLVPAPMMA